MMHLKMGRELPNSVEFHNQIRSERSRIIAGAIGWFVRRAGEMLRTHHSKQSLRDLRDDQLHDIGLTRADVERAGWF